MENPDKKKWCKLSFAYKKDYVILNYIDGYGNKVTTTGNQFHTVSVGRIKSLHVANDIGKIIVKTFTALPNQRATMDGNKTIPLAIYIEHILPDSLKRSALQGLMISNEDIGSIFHGQLEPGDYMVINTLPQIKVKSFELPFRIRFAGVEETAMMTLLKNTSWYKSHEYFEGTGMDLAMLEDPFKGLEKGVDILLVDAKALFEWLSQNDVPARLLPRLLVVTGSYYSKVLDAYPEFLSRDMAVMFLHSAPKSDYTLVVKDILYSIIHDFPLHESLQFALKKNPTFGGLLFASTATNQSLRISDALVSFKTKVSQYERVVNYGDFDNFLRKFEEEPSAGFTKKMQYTVTGGEAGSPGNWPSYFRQINTMGDNFNRETTGLVPLSLEVARFNELFQPQFKKVRKQLQAIVNNNDNFEAIREQQERKVDVTIDSLNDSMLYVPINRNIPLTTRASYRLNVDIGLQSAFSLMTGEVAPIDPLLPDPANAKGHVLDIVVFPKDFSLSTAALQKVTLPLLGAATTAHFLIKTPEEEKVAQLRIGIFYQNNLLQAFILHADVKHQPVSANEAVVKVNMDLSTSEKFTNLDDLRPRDFFIGMNDDSPGSHTIYVKKDQFTGQVRGLSSQLIDETQQQFKQLLTSAYFDEQGRPRFSSYAQPGGTVGEAFFQEVRQFARFGSLYTRKIYDAADVKMQEELDKITKDRKLAIQIGRYDPDNAFPWAMIYDYEPPPDIVGVNNYPVCMGEKFKDGEHDAFKGAAQYGCPHNPDTNSWCIEGFWGIRHQLEHVLFGAAPTDAVKKVEMGPGPAILFSSNSDDADATKLMTSLRNFNPAVKFIEPEMNLMELLWDPKQRPAMLVVLGHMETSAIPGEPNEPRIISFPKEKWKGTTPIPVDRFICHSLLSHFRKTKDKWKPNPLPIVLLINCSVAQMDVRSLNSIVTGFSVAGAAAIVGTECDITSGLGARFVNEIMQSMYVNKKQLGEAIQEFNLNLVRSGNPLAFVFTCYGNINLAIQ